MNLNGLDEEMKKLLSEMEFPIAEFAIFGLFIWVWKKPQLYIEVMETEPYQFDGEMPTVCLKIAWFEFWFDNKTLYKYLYRRKWGFNPRGLE